MWKIGSICVIFLALLACNSEKTQKIDRYALTERNNPVVKKFDELSSLSVGNGNFAFTVDATGLQSFPKIYSEGISLGTQSQWGWHSFPNPDKYKFEETLKSYNFRGKDEIYAVQFKGTGRQYDAANWYRMNPHRLHLGYIGLELAHKDNSLVKSDEIKDINQELKLWDGCITSAFIVDNDSVLVKTACHPQRDQVGSKLHSKLMKEGRMNISFRFPYPTGKHTDDASDWDSPEKHKTKIVNQNDHSCLLKRILDSTVYYVSISWQGTAVFSEKQPHYFLLSPKSEDFSFTCEYLAEEPESLSEQQGDIFALASTYWQKFWQTGGAVDFSKCKDSRAPELERRVVLSQYLMAIQCAGDIPPQETGLTYNSWFGKFHLEMHWWHAVHFALWKRADLLKRSMGWYEKACPVAKSIAERQGFDGIRWMKMTDPSAREAPSSVGSFLIWQQPHYIYLAELIYRDNPSQEVIKQYGPLVEETAAFMASFVTYDSIKNRYIIKGVIPAQETLRASETINPPFELSYWHYGLAIAQKWKERAGKERNPEWDSIIDKLAPLAEKDGLYLAAEDAVDTYKDIRFTSDHPAVLGAMGVLSQSRLVGTGYMKNTLEWIWDNWNWDKTWGWDYPMTAMCAARLGDPEKAVSALLMDKRTNTYLINGHNYQDGRLRLYLPGNGGLLTAVAMMCAGWDGNETDTPGFPKDGNWDVVWEDLSPMP